MVWRMYRQCISAGFSRSCRNTSRLLQIHIIYSCQTAVYYWWHSDNWVRERECCVCVRTKFTHKLMDHARGLHIKNHILNNILINCMEPKYKFSNRKSHSFIMKVININGIMIAQHVYSGWGGQSSYLSVGTAVVVVMVSKHPSEVPPARPSRTETTSFSWWCDTNNSQLGTQSLPESILYTRFLCMFCSTITRAQRVCTWS